MGGGGGCHFGQCGDQAGTLEFPLLRVKSDIPNGGMVESPHIMRGDFILMEGEGGQHVHPPSPPVVIALPGGLLGVGEVTMRCSIGSKAPCRPQGKVDDGA